MVADLEEKQGVMVTISLSKYEDMIAKLKRLEKLEAERDKELDEFEKYHNQIKFWTSEVNRLEKELKQYREPKDFSQLPKERNKEVKPKLKWWQKLKAIMQILSYKKDIEVILSPEIEAMHERMMNESWKRPNIIVEDDFDIAAELKRKWKERKQKEQSK